MQASYNLPPKDLLFKMLDKDLKLIVNNYGSPRAAGWNNIYQSFIEKEQSACPRETALNSQIERPRIVPDSHCKVLQSAEFSLKKIPSLSTRRRSSSVCKKSKILAYKVY